MFNDVLTTTMFETPIFVPHISISRVGLDPVLTYTSEYPSRMSQSQLAAVQKFQNYEDAMGLGAAFVGGVGGALEGASSVIQTTEFTEPGLGQEGALLTPYGGPGGGHHVPAQAVFRGAAYYDANAAPAISNSEMSRLGVDHMGGVTPAQQTLYRAFSKTGNPLTWEAVERIETQALIRGGLNPNTAARTVQQAIQQLKNAGVSGPTHIPWGQ